MRIFLNLVSVCIIAVVAYFASLNMHSSVEFVLRGAHSLPLAYLILGIFAMGLASGLVCAMAFSIPVQKKLKEYQRRLEKTSVQTDEDSSRVAVLEAKIATLEKALDNALNK